MYLDFRSKVYNCDDWASCLRKNSECQVQGFRTLIASYSPWLNRTLVNFPTVAFWSFHWTHLNNILCMASTMDLVSASNWSSCAQWNLRPFPTAFQLEPMLRDIMLSSSCSITLSEYQYGLISSFGGLSLSFGSSVLALLLELLGGGTLVLVLTCPKA